MTRLKEKAADAWQGIDGKQPETQPLSKERIVKTVPSVPLEAKDWNGYTSTSSRGRVIRPGDLDMLTLCNGDQHTVGGSLNRADYVIVAKGAR